MRKGFLILVLLFFGLNEGRKFLLSDKFQKFGDDGKKQWTCYVNNYLGEFFFSMSRFERAEDFFGKITTRCPKLSLAEKAHFKMAACAEGRGNHPLALELYSRYIELYPEGKRAKLAWKKTSVLEQAR